MVGQYQIKRLHSADLTNLTRLIHDFLEADFQGTYQPGTIRAYIRMFSTAYFRTALRQHSTMLGGFDDRRLVGVYVLRKEFGGVGYIEWLGVMPPYRHRGIATALLHAGETIARRRKLHYLYLYTEKESNMEFYQRRGFTYVGTHDRSWYGEREHIFGKHIVGK